MTKQITAKTIAFTNVVSQLFHDTALTMGVNLGNIIHSVERTRPHLGVTMPCLSVYIADGIIKYQLNGNWHTMSE